MINLLPPERQRQFRAARVNVLLLRYVFLTLAAFGLLTAASGASYVMLAMSKGAAEDVISKNAEESMRYQSVDKDAKAFQANLATAKTILDKEVRYSKITVAIAQTLPSNVVLDSLSLDAAAFGESTTLTAKSLTYDDALRLKTSFEESDIFSDVHLASVITAEELEPGEKYPITININVKINKKVVE